MTQAAMNTDRELWREREDDYGRTRLAPAEYGGRLRYVLLACVGLAGAVWLLAIVAP